MWLRFSTFITFLRYTTSIYLHSENVPLTSLTPLQTVVTIETPFPVCYIGEDVLQIRSEKQVSSCPPNPYKRYLRLSFRTYLELTPGSCQIILIGQLAFQSLPGTEKMTYAGSPASRWPRMGPGWWVFVVTSDGLSSNIAFLSFMRARGQWTIKETSPTSHHLHSGVNFGQSVRATAVVMSEDVPRLSRRWHLWWKKGQSAQTVHSRTCVRINIKFREVQTGRTRKDEKKEREVVREHSLFGVCRRATVLARMGR